MTILKAAVIGTALLALGACSSTFEATSLDASGRFPVSRVLPPEAIKVSEAYPVDQSRKLLLVRTNLGTLTNYEEYFETSFENIGFFGTVMRTEEFERDLVRRGLAEEVGSVTGFAGLSKASRALGPFMVVDIQLTADVGYQVAMTMTAYDPATATELFKVDYEVTNWAGLDGVLFEPSFNAFIAWLEENSPTFPENGRGAASE